MGTPIGVDPLREAIAREDVLLEDVGYNLSAAGASREGLKPSGVRIQDCKDVAMPFCG